MSWHSYKVAGRPWGVLLRKLAEKLPDTLEDRDDVAFVLVAEALEQIYGPKEEAWHSFKHVGLNEKQTTWVKAGKKV